MKSCKRGKEIHAAGALTSGDRWNVKLPDDYL